MPNPVFTYIYRENILTIVDNLMPNPVFEYILNIYDLVWFNYGYGI